MPRAQLVARSGFGGSLQLRRLESEQWIWSDQSLKRLSILLAEFLEAEDLPEDRAHKTLSQFQTRWLTESELRIEKGFFGKLRLFNNTRGRLSFKIVSADTPSTYTIRVAAELVRWEAGKPVLVDQREKDPKTAEAQIKLANQWTDTLYEYLTAHWQEEQSVAAVQTVDAFTVNLVQDGNGYPMLTIDQDFMVSWELVGETLLQLSVPVEDLDRTLAIYFIRIPSRSRPELAEQIFELHLMRNEQGSQLTLSRNQDELAPKDVSQEFFEILYAKMQQQSNQ